MSSLEDRTFLVLVAAISLVFGLILWPFFGSILWGTVIAIVFAPLYRRLVRLMPKRRTLAAIVTVLIILVMVILPLTSITASLVQEASGVIAKVQTGELDFGRYFDQVFQALPGWISDLMKTFRLTSLGEVQEKLSQGIMKGSKFIASQAVNIGQYTFDFVVSLFITLYLLFFLLRDGEALSRSIQDAVPLRPEHQRELLARFTVVIRATVKGNIVVALVQGMLGGLAFWLLGIGAPLLWGALMAVLSLLPAVGSGLVWLPVALYLFATHALWKGIALILFGVLVIGLVDNVLRPILVGRDTKLPDYLVLISTLGGIAIFGINGFVLGPVIAALFVAAWDLFAESRKRLA